MVYVREMRNMHQNVVEGKHRCENKMDFRPLDMRV
jgi:hypothetical protein